jgi:hypothetical protein
VQSLEKKEKNSVCVPQPRTTILKFRRKKASEQQCLA